VYSNKQTAIDKLSMSNIKRNSNQDSDKPYYYILQEQIKEAVDNEISLKLCIVKNNIKISLSSARNLPKLKEKAQELEKSLRITRVALEERRKRLSDFLRA
jgi:hypothetical protein